MPGEGLALRGDDKVLAVDEGAVDIENDEVHTTGIDRRSVLGNRRRMPS